MTHNAMKVKPHKMTRRVIEKINTKTTKSKYYLSQV